MRLHSLFSRRPSAALVISVAALFMSVGGVGYAAVSIPNNSVGQEQLRNNAVSYEKIVPNAVGTVRLANGGVTNDKLGNGSVSFRKIQPGAVGTVRANLNQLQARVSGTCAGGSAIGAIQDNGQTTCNSTLPQEYGTSDVMAAVGAAPANVTSVTLPAGPSYLAFANPTISVTSGTAVQRVTVSCTLSVSGNNQSRTVTLRTSGTAGAVRTDSIPFQVAGPAGTALVACRDSVDTGALPTASATAQINALQTAANNG